MPALNYLDGRAAAEQTCYGYRFDWKSPAMGGALGDCLTLEVNFIFGVPEAAFNGTGAEAERRLFDEI